MMGFWQKTVVNFLMIIPRLKRLCVTSFNFPKAFSFSPHLVFLLKTHVADSTRLNGTSWFLVLKPTMQPFVPGAIGQFSNMQPDTQAYCVAECIRGNWYFRSYCMIPTYKSTCSLTFPNPQKFQLGQHQIFDNSLLSHKFHHPQGILASNHDTLFGFATFCLTPPSPTLLSSPIIHPNSTVKKPLNSFSHFWTWMVCLIVEICLALGFGKIKSAVLKITQKLHRTLQYI